MMTSADRCQDSSGLTDDAGDTNSENDDSITQGYPSTDPAETETTEKASLRNCVSRWFERPVYKRYWKHYQYMQDWFNRHNTVVHGLNCLSISGPRSDWNSYMYSVMLSQWSRYYYDVFMRQNQMYHKVVGDRDNGRGFPTTSQRGHGFAGKIEFKKPYPMTKCFSRKRKDRQKDRGGRSSKRSQKRRRQHSVSSLRSTKSQQKTVSDPQELFEMEITGEMLEFFVKSAQHKKEMAALKRKKREEEEETGDYVPLTAANSGRRTTQAPTERPGVRRTTEMKYLYGDGAAMIHGMETAMQLSYDRHFDIHQPKLWPNLPINIKF